MNREYEVKVAHGYEFADGDLLVVITDFGLLLLVAYAGMTQRRCH